MKSKRGLSAIISVLIIIMIVMVAIGIVWMVVLPMIEKNTSYISACGTNILDKLEIDTQNTCYSGTPPILEVTIEIKDIELEKILVSVTEGGTTTSEELTEDDGIAKNSGKKHYISVSQIITGKIDSVKISPVIDGQTCDAVDEMKDVPACL